MILIAMGTYSRKYLTIPHLIKEMYAQSFLSDRLRWILINRRNLRHANSRDILPARSNLNFSDLDFGSGFIYRAFVFLINYNSRNDIKYR